MAETSALNSAVAPMLKDPNVQIKVEPELVVKGEPAECAACAECAVCAARDAGAGASAGCADMCSTATAAGTLLLDFLARFAHCDLVAHSSRQVCKTCLHLITVLEQAELDYLKAKEAFEAIISKNPLFEPPQEVATRPVKTEVEVEFPRGSDSDDEPLAATKKKRRKVDKTKKKVATQVKRKPRSSKKIENLIQVAVTRLNKAAAEETLHTEVVLKDVKREKAGDDLPQATETQHNNLKVETDNDDDDSDFFPDDELSNGDIHEFLRPSARGRPRGAAQRAPKKRKQEVYQCDQCNAKYTSARRLEIHKEKHLEGKPPFICEVCGARYKHKRACDIHVALHKGISDWKCEECNKLFPSKGALQRHNNIHTGRLNYQCDLCGKSFIHTSSFKMHKLSHSGVKPHACDVCGLALMTRSHLKRHKRIHSGEKRHECAVCGKRFSERYNLVAHSKSHEVSGEPPAEAAPRRRLFRCTFCPERFERRYMLERHVSTAHGRTLERAPATPRNTMSKLLKAQAQARAQQPGSAAGAGPAAAPAAPPPALTPSSDITETKQERSPESRAGSVGHKLQLSSVTTIMSSSWSGAYAAEFGLRADFPH